MRTDARLTAYLRSVRSSLRVPRQKQGRVLEEIGSHLDDGVAAHMRAGATRERAVAMIIDELGPPDDVAAAFNDQAMTMPDRPGPWRWLPMVLPVLLFAVAVGLLTWSLSWIPGGLSVGERVVQRMYLRSAVIAGILSYATYFSIRRARSDRAWRWAAWFCAACALLLLTPIGVS